MPTSPRPRRPPKAPYSAPILTAVAVQVYIGGEFETQTVHNLTRMVDLGNRHGVAVLGVTAVGKEFTAVGKFGANIIEHKGRELFRIIGHFLGIHGHSVH